MKKILCTFCKTIFFMIIQFLVMVCTIPLLFSSHSTSSYAVESIERSLLPRYFKPQEVSSIRHNPALVFQLNPPNHSVIKPLPSYKPSDNILGRGFDRIGDLGFDIDVDRSPKSSPDSNGLIINTHNNPIINPCFFNYYKDILQIVASIYHHARLELYEKSLCDKKEMQNISTRNKESLDKKFWELEYVRGRTGVTKKNPNGYPDIPAVVAAKKVNNELIIVIAYHGSISDNGISLTGGDWDTNKDEEIKKGEEINYHSGFYNKMESSKENIYKTIRTLQKKIEGRGNFSLPIRTLYLCGHSAGAALAQLLAFDMCHRLKKKTDFLGCSHQFDNAKQSKVQLVTFSSPRAIAGKESKDCFEKLIGRHNILNIASPRDWIIHTPYNKGAFRYFFSNFINNTDSNDGYQNVGYMGRLDVKKLQNNKVGLGKSPRASFKLGVEGGFGYSIVHPQEKKICKRIMGQGQRRISICDLDLPPISRSKNDEEKDSDSSFSSSPTSSLSIYQKGVNLLHHYVLKTFEWWWDIYTHHLGTRITPNSSDYHFNPYLLSGVPISIQKDVGKNKPLIPDLIGYGRNAFHYVTRGRTI